MPERSAARGRSVGEWLLAAEAMTWLVLAGLALRLLSFATVARLASAKIRAPDHAADETAARRIGWAVDAAAARAPWGPMCFERGLAAHAMLRRRGRNSELCYGARNDGSLGPSAHVWVRSDHADVVGGAEAARFAILAVFPERPPIAD